MAKYTEANLLPYRVILAASGGDVDALNAVLKHYAGYITHWWQDDCITGTATASLCGRGHGTSSENETYH